MSCEGDVFTAALLIGDVIETNIEVQGVAMAAAGTGDPQRALLLAALVEAVVTDELASRDGKGEYRIAEPFLAAWIRRNDVEDVRPR